MATVGWVDNAAADAYIAASIGGTDWAIESSTVRDQYLTAAYRQLLNDPDYAWPSAPSQAMKDAQSEFALYIYQNPTWSQRGNLVAQGVSKFKIGQFEEEYNGKMAGLSSESKYPQNVLNLISIYQVEGGGVGDWSRENR